MLEGSLSSKSSRSGRKAKPFQLVIGKEFENVEEVEAKIRGFIAKTLILAAVVGLAFAGFHGFYTGNFVAVAAVWAVAEPVIGAVVSHYFGPERDNTG